MSFSFGFYNSIEKDRLYDAIQVSKIFDGIIMDGVYATIGDAFIVQAGEEPNLVVVGPGRAWFNHTWNENDGYLEIELEDSETVVDRFDALVIDINERVNSRTNQLLVIKGIPSSTPQKPVMIHEPEHNQYPIAYILRKANERNIRQADIENAVGSTECPFVIGVLETLDANLLLLQWRDAWKLFLDECRAHLNEWEDAVKLDVSNFVTEFKRQCNEFLSDTETWQATQKESFLLFYEEFKQRSSEYERELTDWVDGLKDMVSEDAVGNLLIQISQLKKEVKDTSVYLYESMSGFQSKTTTFSSDGLIITETYEDQSKIITKFLENGNIQSSLVSSNGVTGAVKITEFRNDGSIVETVTGGNSFTGGIGGGSEDSGDETGDLVVVNKRIDLVEESVNSVNNKVSILDAKVDTTNESIITLNSDVSNLKTHGLQDMNTPQSPNTNT